MYIKICTTIIIIMGIDTKLERWEIDESDGQSNKLIHDVYLR